MRIQNTVLGLASIAALVLGSGTAEARRFASPRTSQVHRPDHQPSSPGPLQIVLVGDSWVSGRKLDAPLAADLARHGWPAEVRSYGIPGAKSRTVYNSLFTDRGSVVLRGPAHDFGVVVVGVNDAQGYAGADYYAAHVTLIAQALRARGVFPVLVELPEFDIEHARSTNLIGTARRWAFRHAYHGGDVDVIARYRATLRVSLAAALDSSEYRIVPFDAVAEDYRANLELYAPDRIHLSAAGRERLAAVIGTTVRDIVSRRTDEAQPHRVF